MDISEKQEIRENRIERIYNAIENIMKEDLHPTESKIVYMNNFGNSNDSINTPMDDLDVYDSIDESDNESTKAWLIMYRSNDVDDSLIMKTITKMDIILFLRNEELEKFT